MSGKGIGKAPYPFRTGAGDKMFQKNDPCGILLRQQMLRTEYAGLIIV